MLESYTIKFTPNYEKWFNKIKDGNTKFRLMRRLEKAQRGNLGDVKSIGEGVWEMREFFKPGLRLYYVKNSDAIILLGGGDKSTQEIDIRAAIALSKQLE